MNLQQSIQQLQGKTKEKRFEIISQFLDEWDVHYYIQEYSTGKNIIVNPETESLLHFGVSTSYDIVPNSLHSDKNTASIAVCLALIRKMQLNPFKGLNVIFFFFGEEEMAYWFQKVMLKLSMAVIC